MESEQHSQKLERVPSGISGLDTILQGGFLKGGVYIVQGVPGTGKTVLANHVCFNHVARGGQAIYFTLLAESHARMLQHLRPMAFFDDAVIPDRLYYASAYVTLEEQGLKGLLDLFRHEIRGQKASLLVLDGFVVAGLTAPSEREFKKFVYEVQAYAAVMNCTVLLLTSNEPGPVRAEHTIVDGVIELDDRLFDHRTERGVQIRKHRGSGFLRGVHPFRITAAGIVVYPRIEVAFASPSRRDQPPLGRVSTGIAGLDALIGGGLIGATTSVVMGPTGIGKTTFGLQFLARSRQEEPGLLFGFYETPERLKVKAEALRLDLVGLEVSGAVEIVWQPQGENVLDELGHRLLDSVRRRGVRRLFVDGLGGLIESAIHPQRISRFLSVLTHELRALGATTVFSVETRDIVGPTVQVPIDGISSLVEGMMVLRYVEAQGRTHRVLSITKIRDSAIDPALQAFSITSAGLEVIGPFQGYEAVLSGSAHTPPAPPEGR
ncbi:ATPase domain-containing protein [Azospirillum canadense]|uniref:ATPase domain-containing protein n=1 Tax=Azospirillum canadense TaxID=403962 RepID=UPI0022266D81|nr:ATPase domain-containing protein [Azospirillum canadense]MCW2241477.1 circadian clock protein KaiC [Azospirillum canadense]